MLAFMSQSSPLQDVHSHTSGTTDTMSLAILPSSPMTYSHAAPPALVPPLAAPSKRPKLTLNTADTTPIFSKAATSLRLETLSATSPTTRNTYQNAYNPGQLMGGKQSKPALSRLATQIEAADAQPAASTETETEQESSASTERGDLCSSSSSSSTTSATSETLPSSVPYRTAFNVKSILTNSPLPRARVSCAQPRPLFPTPKKVAFRPQLTEEIRNRRYTMKHSDIESSTSTISTLGLPPPQFQSPKKALEVVDSHSTVSDADARNSLSPQAGDKRESSDEEDEKEDEHGCPVTPVAGRRKRHRQWVWTLGPVEAPAKSGTTAPEALDVAQGEITGS